MQTCVALKSILLDLFLHLEPFPLSLSLPLLLSLGPNVSRWFAWGGGSVVATIIWRVLCGLMWNDGGSPGLFILGCEVYIPPSPPSPARSLARRLRLHPFAAVSLSPVIWEITAAKHTRRGVPLGGWEVNSRQPNTARPVVFPAICSIDNPSKKIPKNLFAKATFAVAKNASLLSCRRCVCSPTPQSCYSPPLPCPPPQVLAGPVQPPCLVPVSPRWSQASRPRRVRLGPRSPSVERTWARARRTSLVTFFFF